VIEATIVTIEGERMTPAQVAQIGEDLSEAVGGPVTIDALILSGDRGEIKAGLEQVFQIEDLFTGEIVKRGAQVDTLAVDPNNRGGYTITSRILIFEENQLTQDDIEAIQETIGESTGSPVNLRVTVLPAAQFRVDAPSPATPTPEP
jgi:hypothetical protein